MLDNGSYFETCHNRYPSAMSTHSPDWLELVHSNRRFAMEMMALDGTFDVRLALRASHKIVAANRSYWAFDRGQLALRYPLNILVVPNDAKRKLANRLNVMATLPMLFDIKNRANKEKEMYCECFAKRELY